MEHGIDGRGIFDTDDDCDEFVKGTGMAADVNICVRSVDIGRAGDAKNKIIHGLKHIFIDLILR